MWHQNKAHRVQPIKFSVPVLAVSCTRLLNLTSLCRKSHCIALQKVVEVSAMEEGHQHSEDFMGCTVAQ